MTMVGAGSGGLLGLLTKLFAILVIAFLHTQPAPSYDGPNPLLTSTPAQPHANQVLRIHLYGMPAGASQVTLVSADDSWPAKRDAPREYLVPAVKAPKTAGAWSLDVAFRLHGYSYTIAAGILNVRPAPKP
jgi:hypothetical protein